MVFMTPTIKTYLIYQLKYLLLCTIIDFNEVDIRIYQPEKRYSPRPQGRGEYHF